MQHIKVETRRFSDDNFGERAIINVALFRQKARFKSILNEWRPVLNLNLDFIINHIMCAAFRKVLCRKSFAKLEIYCAILPDRCDEVTGISVTGNGCRSDHLAVIAVHRNRHPIPTSTSALAVGAVVGVRATVVNKLLSQSHAYSNRFSLCLSYHKTSAKCCTMEREKLSSAR